MSLPAIMSAAIDVLLFICIFVNAKRMYKLERRLAELKCKYKALVITTEDSMKQTADRIADLEKGVIPDYETAKKAADAVNDFSKGITSILGFDPYAALHKDDEENE